MDTILETLGLTSGELIQLLVLGVALMIVLFLARLAFKLTATLIRIGCIGIILIVAVVFILNLLN